MTSNEGNMNISLMDLLFSFTALLHKVVKLETGKKGVGLVLWNFNKLNAKISLILLLYKAIIKAIHKHSYFNPKILFIYFKIKLFILF